MEECEGSSTLRATAVREVTSSCTATRRRGVTRVQILQPGRRAQHRRRARRAGRRRDRRARRLLRRRHEQAREHHRARQCRARRRREHDVGHGPRARASRRRRRRVRARRTADHRRRRVASLRHLAEGRRHRRRRQTSAASPRSWRRRAACVDLRRRGRCARRFAVRSRDLRARRDPLARRRCARRADDRRGSTPRCASCWTRPASRTTPNEFKRVASARALYHWNADANQEY